MPTVSISYIQSQLIMPPKRRMKENSVGSLNSKKVDSKKLHPVEELG